MVPNIVLMNFNMQFPGSQKSVDPLDFGRRKNSQFVNGQTHPFTLRIALILSKFEICPIQKLGKFEIKLQFLLFLLLFSKRVLFTISLKI